VSFLRRIEAVLLPLISGTLLVLVWHLSVVWSKSTVFPKPALVWSAMVEIAQQGKLLGYVGDSLFRVGVGFALGVVTGVPAGLVCGWYPSAERAANPVIQLLRPISPLAWIPLAIIFFGITNASAIFLIYLASFFPIVVSAMNGVKNVPLIYLRAGTNFGLSTREVFTRVVLPAALPSMLTGLRIALGVAWLVVVAAEMIAVNSGLGYLIIDSRNAGKRYDLVIGGMVVIGVLGLLLDVLSRRLESVRYLSWGFRKG
jgi:NitT/TauT family transport system permease protein